MRYHPDTSGRRISALARPAIPDDLVEVNALTSRVVGQDDYLNYVCVTGAKAEQSNFTLFEVEESRIEQCSFLNCDFSRTLFTDVAFSGCDFSNSNFSEANFTRCTFASCKFMGALFVEAVLNRVEVRDSVWSYSSLAKAKLEDVAVIESDFSHADIVETRLRRVSFDKVRFVGTSFFRTNLMDIDLTSCALDGIVLSDTMGELKGCTMDVFQAAGIAQRLGVRIQDI